MDVKTIAILFATAVLLPTVGGIFSAMLNRNGRAKFFGFLSIVSGFIGIYLSFMATKADLTYKALHFKFEDVNCFFLGLNALGIIVFAIYNMGLAKVKRAVEQQYRSYYVVLGLFVSSLLLIPTMPIAESLLGGFLFLIAWEIMSSSSFVLMIFNEKEVRLSEKALIYFIAMHLSAVFLMLGIFASASNYNFALIAFIVGFGIKLGLFPGHFYMADGYDALPGASAPLTAGVMINMGVYGLFQSCLQFNNSGRMCGYILIIVGLISAIYGVIWALSQRKMKKVLASSSMENMGIIAVAIGIVMLPESQNNKEVVLYALFGCFIHLFNHSLLKGLLFYTTDIVKNTVGETNLNKLGGVAKLLPKTMKNMLVGSMGLSAVPTVCGFIGKFLIYYSALLLFINKEFPLSVQIMGMIIFVVLGMVGALSLFVFVKFFAMTFLGAERSEFNEVDASAENFHTVFACRLLAMICVIFGGLPILYCKCLPGLSNSSNEELKEIGKILTDLSILSIIAIGVIFIIWLLRKILLRKRSVENNESTWGCGYEKFNPKLEYNGDSLSLSLLWLLDKIFIRKEKGIDIKELYPESFDHDYATKEVIRDGVLAKVCSYLFHKLELLQVIQSGVMQRYLWISVLFFVVVLIYAILS